MPQTIDLTADGGEQADGLRSGLGNEHHAVCSPLQTRDAFALVVRGVGELRGLPEHEACFGEEPTAKFDERGCVIFNCAAYVEAHVW